MPSLKKIKEYHSKLTRIKSVLDNNPTQFKNISAISTELKVDNRLIAILKDSKIITTGESGYLVWNSTIPISNRLAGTMYHKTREYYHTTSKFKNKRKVKTSWFKRIYKFLFP